MEALTSELMNSLFGAFDPVLAVVAVLFVTALRTGLAARVVERVEDLRL